MPLLVPSAPFGPLITAMVTPFDASGAIDFYAVEKLSAHLLQNGSSGLVITGTTGESPTLSPEEKIELYRKVKSVAGKASVIANTGDNETSFSIEFSRRVQDIGVDALLLVVPYYNRPSQEGLFRHFEAIATAVDLPCLLYNVPARTARNLEASTVARLSQIPNIVGIKEASGDLSQIAHIRASTPPEFLIYSGNDADTLPMLTLGCCGVVSVASHVAGKLIAEMMSAFWSGDTQRAMQLHLQLMPIFEALFPASSPSPAPVKAGLQMQNVDCGGLRLPLVEATASDRENLRSALQSAGLL
jgi:4-hydroxy-tetrahydrodipicolinate synthase